MPPSLEKNLFVPPQSLHCLSYPTPDWRDKVQTITPPEKQFQEMALLRMTRAFDQDFYWNQNPDVRRDQRDPVEHYLYHGASEDRKPHPDFHPSFYRRQSGISRETNPLLHYLLDPGAVSWKPNPDWSRGDSALPWVHPFEYLELKGVHQSKPPVCLDFQTRDFYFDKGRYWLTLGLAVLEAGHPLFILAENYSCLPRAAVKLLLQEPGVQEIQRADSIPGRWIRLSDSPAAGNSLESHRIRLLLESSPTVPDCLPYPIHSSVLRSRAHRNLRVARQRERTLGILFAGQNPWGYRLTSMAKSHGLMNRHQVLKSARTFLKDRCDHGVNHDRLIQERSPQDPPVVFIDSKKWRIIPQCWLDRLGYARFFLCPPGALHPVAHNLPESMAVGTVPILEYGHLLHPPLQDGLNCLAFQGPRGLQEKLELALTMPSSDWEKLHRGAMEYFDQHLNFPEAVRRLLQPGSEVDAVSLPFKN